MSKREVEIVVARLAPRPDAITLVRKLPMSAKRERLKPQAVPDTSTKLDAVPDIVQERLAPSPRRPVIVPLAPERFKLQITMSQKTHDTLRQLQNLMRHSVPNGDAAVIVERALQVLLQEMLRRKCGMRKRDLPVNDPEQPERGGHRRLLH